MFRAFIVAVFLFPCTKASQGTCNAEKPSVSFQSDAICLNGTLSSMESLPIGIEESMVFIPGAEFFMGTKTPIIQRDGETQRRVKVSSFLIDKYEISNSDFHLFIKSTRYITDSERFNWSFVFKYALSEDQLSSLTHAVKDAEWWVPVPNSSWLYPEGRMSVFESGREKFPVVHISWNDADAFCKWRNDSRLPSEAEWELAANRGRDQLFPWGDKILLNKTHRANIFQGEFPTRNTARDGYALLAPVDAYPPQNELGMYNMIGNAWEWVQDCWSTDHSEGVGLGEERADDGKDRFLSSTGPSFGKERVKKGGSNLCHKNFCYRYRTAARHHSTPDSATSNSGFRCAKSIS